MSKQVLDIQQMQHLEELGVDTSKANFYWHRTKSLNNYEEWDEWKLHYGVLKLVRGFTTINCQYVRTFTLQDILDLLPTHISDNSGSMNILNIEQQIQDGTRVWNISYLSTFSFIKIVSSINNEFIDAAYEMLCWCAENGYVETKKSPDKVITAVSNRINRNEKQSKMVNELKNYPYHNLSYEKLEKIYNFLKDDKQ